MATASLWIIVGEEVRAVKHTLHWAAQRGVLRK